MTSTLLHFVPYSLDLSNQRLLGSHGVIALRPKSFAVLQYLAQHAGRLVQKAELMAACWPGVAVGDAVIKDCIREIRAALGDSARAPRYIRTQSRLGYCFVAEVRGTVPDESGSPAGRRAADVATAASEPLLGRDADLNRLLECLASADSGTAQIVLVSGEAGAGKTALVDSFLRRCAGDGALVGRGQCIEQHGPSESYMPVLAALQGLAQRLDRHRMSERLLHSAPTWLRQLPGLSEAIGLERIEQEVLGAGRERMLREGADGLMALSQEHGIVLLLEDLHWADAATLDLVNYLAQRRLACRLLLIATLRATPGAVGAQALQLGGLAARGLATSIQLTPLTAADVTLIVEERLPTLAAGTADQLARAVYTRTDGNPLFVRAVLDELSADARLAGDLLIRAAERSLPPSIQGLVEQILAGLGAAEQQILEAASVAGEDPTTDVIAAALQQRSADVEVLLESVSRRQSLLQPLGVHKGADGCLYGRYGFLHSLFRDLIYRRIGAKRKTSYHLSAGNYLAQRPHDLSIQSAATLAYHFEQGFDFPSAIHWLAVLAWREVVQLGDRSAVRHLDHALAISESLDSNIRSKYLSITLERRALLLSRFGNIAAAAADYERIVRLAEAGDQLSWQARGLAGLATLLSWVAPARAILAAEQASLLAERQGAPALAVRARGLHGFLRCLFGPDWRASDAEACLQASQIAPADSELPAGNCWTYGVQIQSLHGDYEGSRVAAQRGITLALKQNDSNEYLFLRYHQSGALFNLGRFGEALHLLGDAQQLAQRNGDVAWAVMIGAGQACIEAQCFAFRSAIERSQRALHFASQSPIRLVPLELMSSAIIALSLIGEGRLTEAKESLISIYTEDPLSFNLRMTILITQIELALAYDDLMAVDRHARRLLALTQAAGEPTGLVWARRSLALVASRCRRFDEAESELSHAAAVLAAKPAPVAAWRFHLAAAEIYEAQGRLGAASHARQRCAATLASIGRSLEGWDTLRQTFCAHPTVAQLAG